MLLESALFVLKQLAVSRANRDEELFFEKVGTFDNANTLILMIKFEMFPEVVLVIPIIMFVRYWHLNINVLEEPRFIDVMK